MAIVVLLALIAAACGSDEGGSQSVGNTTTTADFVTTTTATVTTEAETATTLAGSQTTVAGPGTTLAGGGPTTSAKRSTTTMRRGAATTMPRPAAPTTTVQPQVNIPDHPVQGVTVDSIKIGVMAPLSTNNTDLFDFYRYFLRKWKDEGLLPVHGRNIELVSNTISPATNPAANTASQRAACVQQVTKDKVFYIMGNSGVYDASVCVAKEYHVLFSGAGGVSANDEDLQGAWPFMFWNNMSTSKALRNWPHWAKDQGFLGSATKIGVLIGDNPAIRDDFNKNFKPQLNKLGHKIAAEAIYRDASSIPTAVQRFKSSGVDVVFMGTNAGFVPFAQELDQQNFKPDVLMTDWDSSAITGSGSAGTGRDLPDSFRGSAMTYYHRAEDGSSSNPPLPPQAQQCLDDVAKYTGRRLIVSSGGKPTADTTLASQAEHACDQMQILIEALQRAGRNLSTESMLAALERTKNIDHGQIGPISFTSTKHDGATLFKTITWDYNCDCWKYQGGFRPLWTD